MKPLLFLLIFLSIILISVYGNEDKKVLNLYPEDQLPDPNDPNIFYIPIIHTNDIHGSFYPKKVLLPNGKTYKIGGLEYLAKYINIMSKIWGNRLLYFDSGDQFQGGIEGYISRGKIIMDYFNEIGVQKSVIGNHEFDYGMEFLKKYMNLSKFDWIIDNIKNKTSGQYITFPHQKKSTIIEIEGIKIGIIGLATVETPSSTKTRIPDLEFEDYKKIIEDESAKLKNDGAAAVIVLAHVGVYCRNDKNEVKLKYKLRDKLTAQGDCNKNDEAYILLNKLNSNIIDLFLAGHRHDIVHNWINNIPVSANGRNGKYTQIIYLPFHRDTHKLINDKIVIEGPIPICEKLFEKKQICDLAVVDEKDEENFGELLNYKFRDQIISNEEKITEIGKKYLEEFNKYDKDILTFTLEHIESTKERENVLGNFYTDFLRQISGADISLVNAGSFRTPLYRGNITNATIHSFDPFGSNIIKFKAYGWEVKKIIEQIQIGKHGLYPISGLKIILNKKYKKLTSIKLYDGYKETEFEDGKEYTLASNDFCFPLNDEGIGGDDFTTVYQWFRPRDKEKVIIGNNNNSRDLLIEYLRNIEQLKGDNHYNLEDQRIRIVE